MCADIQLYWRWFGDFNWAWSDIPGHYLDQSGCKTCESPLFKNEFRYEIDSIFVDRYPYRQLIYSK